MSLPPICATVQEADTDSVLARMQEAAPHCAWLELRVDAASSGALDLERIVAERPRPLVVTHRPAREGGAFEGDEGERLEVLARAARLGAERVDVEWDAVDALPALPDTTELIVSRHAFEPLPPDTQVSKLFEHVVPPAWEELFASVHHERAHLQKVAVAVSSAEQAFVLLERSKQEAKPTLAIAMGFPGVVSRIAGPRWGVPFSYAAADPERPAAPGQLSAEALAGLWAGRTVSPSTRLYGVMGCPVDHSRSPELHNAAFAELGVDAVYTWLETHDPLALLNAVDRNTLGFSVTMPHKQAVMRRHDMLKTGEAAAVRAVNTIWRKGIGKCFGANTDALAAHQLLAEALNARPAEPELPIVEPPLRVDPGVRIALLGSGGAARAVAWAGKDLGARVEVYARSEERGSALAKDLGVHWGGPLAAVPDDADAVVNATSVGMQPDVDATPVPAGTVGRGKVAYDLVYTPVDTRFLTEARASGAKTITGLQHFARQAEEQLRRWLGAETVARLPAGWLEQRLQR